ncbi:MAG: 5'/3'-nucleotidase SurE [Holosporales bacterium]|jgi:5'-nucleotidase|nr:5'/3'-nucleotidase SurE [Holosporales bacterium]
MKILISNDDGIRAAGISVLEEIAKSISEDVYVVAPDTNMSGAGHSLTLKTPLRLNEHDDHHFSVNGTPTDSVVMALKHVINPKPDIMLSGINYDSNLAEDINYSGTVAAAMEACLLGVSSIAFSQRTFHDGNINWDIARKYGAGIIETIVKEFEFPKNVLLNINFPAANSVGEVRGIKITRQGFRVGENHVIQSVDPRGDPYFWIGGVEHRKNDMTKELETDLGAVNNNFISITPISLDFTAVSTMKDLEEIFK